MRRIRYAVMIGAVLVVGFSACQQGASKLPAETERDFANALYNRELYNQSINEYEYYLRSYNMDEQEQANISFIIGNIYFERLKDYENALAYYLRIKQVYPGSNVADEANKRIVECLERLERSADAQQALEEATFVDPSKARKSRPGEVIATIGDREITTGDLEYEMKMLPPYMKSQIKDGANKLEFLRQYIATELLFDSARRQGLERDPEVTENAFQAKKTFMVQKLLQEELSKDVSLSEDDLRNYFQANLGKYTEKDSTGSGVPPRFEDVRSKVTQNYILEKQQAAYDRMIERMMRAQAVEIFEDKLK
ncbi:MAG: hypothetical protein H6696_02385 [Deferribacteres bacterium]|nr:hypothetical protein [candidate division KSB1 bacterium]MCB9500762.1 hypothetical protein [Deferribacteres bacterium]